VISDRKEVLLSLITYHPSLFSFPKIKTSDRTGQAITCHLSLVTRH
jgi:hypothetical protein